MGHYLFFIKLPSFFLYISSFPTVYKKKFHLCDQKTYKSILGVWQRNMLKPNFVNFPESRFIRRKIFREFVPKPNEK